MAGEINIKPNALQKLIHRFLMLKAVSRFLSVVLYRADMFMFRLTKGRSSIARIVGLPIIQLTTKGAKTGQLRTIPLVAVPDGNRLVLIASFFGGEHNPSWYYNLKANPECKVIFQGQPNTYIAHEVFDAEHEHCFQLAVSYYAGYKLYRERAAHRHIPVMVLEPKP